MKRFTVPRTTVTLFCVGIALLLFSAQLWAFELNDDGRSLIRQATQAYTSDMQDRATITDPGIVSYINRVARRLVPKGKQLPPSEKLSVTIIDTPKPELYAYIDGHIIITTGMIFAVNNEAQLAGVLSHEVAHIVDGYYITMYQAIKAAERRERRKAFSGALFTSLLDVAVDYSIEMEEIRQTDRLLEGDTTYRETMQKLAAIHAAQSAYYSVKDVIESVPPKDSSGNWVDPRLQFEPIADAQGMVYLAQAGYDASEAAKGWENVHRINNRLAREQELAMGGWTSQLREMENLMEASMNRLRQSLGASGLGLVQTLSSSPPTRPQFVAELTKLQEVQTAQRTYGRKKGETEYREFLTKTLLSRAEESLRAERYEQALHDYKLLYEKGVRTGPVVYGLAKSSLGDFAFAASDAEKQETEKLYREAVRLDPQYAMPYKGLGELYDDWERYRDAVHAYRKYLELSPSASDREQIERKIKILERKASR